MGGFTALGAVAATALLAGLTLCPSGAAIGGRYLAYDATVPGGGATAVAYALAVCVPLLLSSHRRIALFGVLNVPVVVLLSVLVASGFISLWCVWAAVTSIVLARQVRASAETRRAGVPARRGIRPAGGTSPT